MYGIFDVLYICILQLNKALQYALLVTTHIQITTSNLKDRKELEPSKTKSKYSVKHANK